MNKTMRIGIFVATAFVSQRRVHADNLPAGPLVVSETASGENRVSVGKTNLQNDRTQMTESKKEKKALQTQTGKTFRHSMYRYGVEDEGTQQSKVIYDAAQVSYKDSAKAYSESGNQLRKDTHDLNQAQQDLDKSRRETAK